MVLFLSTPNEVSRLIASSAQERRLSLNYTQRTLSDRSGVSLGVIKKFERTGRISLESLLKLALVLGCLEDFKDLFKKVEVGRVQTLDEVLRKDKRRKRGSV